ncbi:hypothetical protein PybrP1_007888 [[Pythium] brassicae (nom. inval.)]|nr:hypothetical protein PybrP1_007888 [[Pythium] brassicae (nom. inval.)]
MPLKLLTQAARSSRFSASRAALPALVGSTDWQQPQRRGFSSWGAAQAGASHSSRGGRNFGGPRDQSDRGRPSPRDRRAGGSGDRRAGGGARWPAAQTLSAKTVTNDGEPIPQIRGEGVYGLHSVLQVLASDHRRVHTLYVRDPVGVTAKKTAADAQALEKIKALAAATGVEVVTTSKWMLNHITSDKPHQGVVLDADPIHLPEFVAADPSALTAGPRQPVVLALDEVHDPQNLGAILRSAHFLGCSAVVVSERNSAPLSPANKLFKARNLHEALAVSSDLGWRVVGACSGPNSVTSEQLGSDKPTVLVMGNEHRGLRKGIRQTCDEIVTIPGHHDADADSHVDSLNVSVAAAVLLYELLRH